MAQDLYAAFEKVFGVSVDSVVPADFHLAGADDPNLETEGESFQHRADVRTREVFG